MQHTVIAKENDHDSIKWLGTYKAPLGVDEAWIYDTEDCGRVITWYEVKR
jgi:hypothetical protein